ncbi:hypothetical protein [Corynebacterium sp. 335C]
MTHASPTAAPWHSPRSPSFRWGAAAIAYALLLFFIPAFYAFSPRYFNYGTLIYFVPEPFAFDWRRFGNPLDLLVLELSRVILITVIGMIIPLRYATGAAVALGTAVIVNMLLVRNRFSYAPYDVDNAISYGVVLTACIIVTAAIGRIAVKDFGGALIALMLATVPSVVVQAIAAWFVCEQVHDAAPSDSDWSPGIPGPKFIPFTDYFSDAVHPGYTLLAMLLSALAAWLALRAWPRLRATVAGSGGASPRR